MMPISWACDLLRGGHVAAAVLDHHLQQERHVLGQGGDHVVAVDDLDLVVGLDVGPRDRAAGVLLDADHAGLLAVVLDHQRLDVEHDVGHVVQHAGQRGELVLGAVQLDLGHGAPFQAGKEHAPQAVADGHAEPALERFDRELAVGARQGRSVRANLTGQLESCANEYAWK